jgi:hypothetical protein
MRGPAIFLRDCVLARDAGCDDFAGAHQWQLRTRLNYAFGYLQDAYFWNLAASQCFSRSSP